METDTVTPRRGRRRRLVVLLLLVAATALALAFYDRARWAPVVVGCLWGGFAAAVLGDLVRRR